MTNYPENFEGSNINDISASFYVKRGIKLAIAEISCMDKTLAEDFLSEVVGDKLKVQFKTAIEQAQKIYFFNRLNVPEKLREQGIGKQLLSQVLNFCKETNSLLINTASSYSDNGLEQEDLIKFYEKNGMMIVNPSGLLIYHSSLFLEKENNTKTKFDNKIKI